MSNGQAIVNPEHLRKFAADLKRFTDGLKNDSARLHGQFQQLGETWRDQEQAKFAVEFEQTMKVIKKFMEASNQYIQFLKRKADAAQVYLDQR